MHWAIGWSERLNAIIERSPIRLAIPPHNERPALRMDVRRSG